MDRKKQLRQEILQKRDALSLVERKEKSRQISERVIQHPAFLDADKILLYASFRSEVDTKAIFQTALEMKKQVYFPKVIGKEMEFYQVRKEDELLEGYCGILEPKTEEKRLFLPQSEDKVFVLMPAAVVDRKGGRIGYGGGYYDKYLQQLEYRVKKGNLYKLAAVFSCQLVDDDIIPKERYDVSPDEIMTEFFAR